MLALMGYVMPGAYAGGQVMGALPDTLMRVLLGGFILIVT